jgi:glycosyltransferase involved in cell wall biosynthesis
MIRFLCIGKLGQRRKNHLHLLSALEDINVNCSLTFVGAGPGFKYTDIDYFNELKLRAEASTIKGGVNILMDLPYDEMRNTYKDFDILVMPSEREAHGQAILEGLAAGLAVISTDDCGAAGYIQNGYNGLIYEKNNIRYLKDKISYLTEDTARIMELSKNALEYIKSVHSGLKFVQSIESL